MQTQEFKIGGRIYITCAALAYGDYSGTGAVGKANQRWLEEQHDGIAFDSFRLSAFRRENDSIVYAPYDDDIPRTTTPVIELYGAYNHAQYAVLRNGQHQHIIDALATYSLIDEDYHQVIVEEALAEAIGDYCPLDLRRAMIDAALTELDSDYIYDWCFDNPAEYQDLIYQMIKSHEIEYHYDADQIIIDETTLVPILAAAILATRK